MDWLGVSFDKIAKFLKHPLVLVGFGLMLFFGVQNKLIDKGIIPQLTQQDGSIIAQLLLSYGFWLGVLIMLLGFGLQFYRVHSDKEVKKKNPPTSPT